MIGFDPHVENFFWCAGQGGYGVQTAPALARLSSALARGALPPPDIVAQGVIVSSLSPARFAADLQAGNPFAN